MNDYHLCRSGSVDDLEKQVKIYLDDGWELYGTPFAWTSGAGTPMIVQAVVKP